MKRLLKKFEQTMMAVTFAEAGELDTARQLAEEKEEKQTGPEAKEVCGGTGTESGFICS